MNEFYRVPALALLSMLLIVFGLLYLQARTTRRLLWLIGWGLAVLRMATEVARVHSPGGWLALSNAAMVLSAFMFLGSMSPHRVKRGLKILYVNAFAAPLLLLAIISSLYPDARGGLRLALTLCMAASVYVAVLWSRHRNLLPPWFSTPYALLAGSACIWLTYKGDYMHVLYLAQSSSNLITALLFAAAYRRLTPGAIFTSVGFFAWSLPSVLDSVFIEHGLTLVMIARCVNLVKVMTAVGMILLVLEDEVAQNKTAKERDHRARVELERYAAIDLSLLADVNTEAAYQHACEVITQTSRFSQALLFLRDVDNCFEVTAHSGMDASLVSGLAALGRRVTHEQAEVFQQSEYVVAEVGNTLLIDLRPLLNPNDELKQLNFLHAHAIPLLARTGSNDGALLLSGLKRPNESLQADDVLPLELLVSRLAAMRENNALMQRVARSEKLAGLGRLAAGVSHELNNPLTVVLGYSELVEEALEDHPARNHVSLIRSEAQRMRQIIENMLRFWRASPIEHTNLSIAELLQDIHQLLRPEFERRRVEFLLHIPDDLPPVHANRNQLQQMFLQVLNNALEAFSGRVQKDACQVRVNVSSNAGNIKILIFDNGPGFAEPGRVFDPSFTAKPPRSGAWMGLSVCYAIVRDHGGEITAHNLQPHGAAVVIDLPAKISRRASALHGEAVAQ